MILTAIVVLVWANNTSMFVETVDHQTLLIAHRGVHQTYAGTDLDQNTCTAVPITPANHVFIENTLPSMAAAFEAGADVVELDIHLTTDGVFAVFHDWTLECRTNGAGVTHKQTWADLQTLDVGYRYSKDGQSYPLRGTGVGLMPRLEDVIDAFPDQHFMINFKSGRASEGRALAAMLQDSPWKDQVWSIYGDPTPTLIAAEALDVQPFLMGNVRRCAIPYILLGWSGYVPQPCRNGIVAVPQNYAPYVWGWPHRFTQRMKTHRTEVILIGPFDGSDHTRGIDDAEMLADVPDAFDGYVWTNRVEIVGPLKAN